VIEVVVDLRRVLDEAEAQPFGDVEVRLAVQGAIDVEARRERLERRVEVIDPQCDVPERTAVAGALGREERQLPTTRVGTDERELVGPLDHVHAEVRGDEICDSVAVGDPERDVVKRLRSHGAGRYLGRVR
jgi:hypothetical protein